MPNFDGSGPRGEGPMTGRGAGTCDDEKIWGIKSRRIPDAPLTRKPLLKSNTTSFYCSDPRCGTTTKHERMPNGKWRCTRCGTSKVGTGTFESRLARALGLIREDKAILFKHEGLAKKASAGSHKFDAPPEYHQLKYDGKWGTKSSRNKLNS